MKKHKVPALAPTETVTELDRYIIGQDEAKRAVAIALRNRWRRQQVKKPLQDEITPKNILMIGPTGVGKTEIARRLAQLAQSPFIKVEASRFTEVGYVGRDVESIIRDLVRLAVDMVRREEEENVRKEARKYAEERLLDLLLPASPQPQKTNANVIELGYGRDAAKQGGQGGDTRERFRAMLRKGELDGRSVEIETPVPGQTPTVEVMTIPGMEEMQSSMQEAFSKMFPDKKEKRMIPVPEALEYLAAEEAGRLVDQAGVTEEAIRRTEQTGIVFLDEIDKIASRGGGASGEVSREGVQRDLLPLVEGTTVNTKFGPVKTDHILFIAGGAFHLCKPSDLAPELQGRFPIRVNLNALGEGEFYRILTEPKNALIRQYTSLLATDGVELEFEDAAIREMARIAMVVNSKTEDIGARRLHTIIERVLDEISFNAPGSQTGRFVINADYVRKVLDDISDNEDLSRYIL